jgi:hypothetical protein
MKFKMAATAGLSLTLDPMGKMFQNASSLKSRRRDLNIFPQDPMLIYVLRWRPSWISDRHKKHIFCRGLSNDHYADRKSKMAATVGHRLTLDPMGKCSNAFFSETTNMIIAKLHMNVH